MYTRFPIVLLLTLSFAAPISMGADLPHPKEADVPPPKEADLPPPKEWVHKQVIIKTSSVRLNLPDGSDVGLKEFDYNIFKVVDDRIYLRQNGKEGWIERSNAVLVDGAVKYFTEIINNNPRNADAYARRGWAWKQKDEGDIALDDLEKAATLDPTNSQYLIYYGNVWRSFGHEFPLDYDAAIKWYDNAISLDRTNAIAWRNKGYAQFKKEKYDWAIEDYRAAIRFDPDDPEGYYYRGLAYAAQENYDRAIADYKTAIHIDCKSAKAYSAVGAALQKKAKRAVANIDLVKALHLEYQAIAAFLKAKSLQPKSDPKFDLDD